MLEGYEFKALTVFVLASVETELLKETVKRVLDSCDNADIEKIVIALKSAECPSAVVAKALAQGDRCGKIDVYIQRGNRLTQCLAELPKLAKGSHFVIISADMEMVPETVADFIREAKAYPYRITCASKWLDDSLLEKYGAFRAFCTRSLNRAASLLYSTDATDLFSLYQIFPTELYRQIRFSEDSRFFYEFTLKPLRLGTDYAEIPASFKKEEQGTHGFGVLTLAGVAVKYLFIAVIIRLTPKRWLRNGSC